MLHLLLFISFFFFNDTATTEIYTLSLHDALPIYWLIFRISYIARNIKTDFEEHISTLAALLNVLLLLGVMKFQSVQPRSEEHTSELQSRLHLVCRLLLEKKKKHNTETIHEIYKPF